MKTLTFCFIILFPLLGCYKSTAAGDNTMKAQAILKNLNAWDKDLLKNYENFRLGRNQDQDKLPAEQTLKHVDSSMEMLRDLGYLVYWNPKKTEYYIIAVISKITNDIRVIKILTMLNAWDKEDIKSYELSRQGKIPAVLPSGEVGGLIAHYQDELKKLGYIAVWDWDKSLYDVSVSPSVPIAQSTN
jgi:hypothetical protein